MCLFERLLGDGSELGLQFSYAAQDHPRGLADAFIVGRKFVGSDRVALILGDNIFYGHGLTELLSKATSRTSGATIFGYVVNVPQRKRRLPSKPGRCTLDHPVQCSRKKWENGWLSLSDRMKSE